MRFAIAPRKLHDVWWAHVCITPPPPPPSGRFGGTNTEDGFRQVGGRVVSCMKALLFQSLWQFLSLWLSRASQCSNQ